jgi:excisionase family DNA binding protein
MENVPQRLWKVKEAAKYLSLSPWKIRHLVIDGTLPYLQLEERGPFLLDVRDIDTFIEAQKRMY